MSDDSIDLTAENARKLREDLERQQQERDLEKTHGDQKPDDSK
jgi:hypothetical protein